MKDFAFVKTLAAALVCGMGVILGVVLSAHEGARAWLFGGLLVVIGLVVAAIPAPKRRQR